MKKFATFIVCLLLCSNAIAQDEKFYDRHIIIAVDQKMFVDANQKENRNYAEGFDKLYKALKGLIINGNFDNGINKDMSQVSSGFKFDKETDRISLFAFGLPYKNYKKVKTDLKTEYSFDKITDVHFHERASYYKGCQEDIRSFADKELYSLFYNDKVRDDFFESGKKYHNDKNQPLYGIELSHYVYPLILKYIDTSIKAKEYYLLIVSDYDAASGFSDPEDRIRINELLSNDVDKYKMFFHDMNEISSLYSSPDVVKIIPDGFGERKNLNDKVNGREYFPFIMGKRIMLDACLGASAFVSSDITLKQKELDGSDYKLSPMSITFNHDGGIKLEKIKMTMTGPKGETILERIYNDANELRSMYNETGKCYNIPGADSLNIKNLAVGDTLFFNYVFFTDSDSPDKGKQEIRLPYIFTTEKKYVITDSVFIPQPQYTESDLVTMFAFISTISILLIALLSWLRRYRGKNRKVNFDFKIWPITNERFMEVKNKHVIDYDCWYWNGERDHNIRITGQYDAENKVWAKRYKYMVEFKVEDVDANEDFSFRPSTDILKPDGSMRVAGEWYTAQEDSSENGKFSLNANVFISDGFIPNNTKIPNFEVDNILKIKVSVRVAMVDKKNNKVIKYIKTQDAKGNQVEIMVKRYTFIIKPRLENSNLWMAFDPGTTGSCVAYGVAALPGDTNDIHLAKNPYQDIDGEWKEGVVFPSKVRINKRSARIFGNNPFKAEELIEGEGVNDDYTFGNRAEMMSSKNGANTFQSIKKLLGYTTPQKVVSDQGEVKEIAGQDIAHLLVRGLYNHVESFITEESRKNTQRSMEVKAMFMRNGYFEPQRAIVAVPNNYTLVKIQEMVDSVKRMNKFKEVHYIYESEAVMMTYLRENFMTLIADSNQLKNRAFIVYDMGGATINATAFRLKLDIESNRGVKNIRSIDVETVAKVGYGVGGDDIDYALIQLIYGAPSVRNVIGDNAESHQKKNKYVLIKLVREIKLSWIASCNATNMPGFINNIDDLWLRIWNVFSELNINLPETPTANDVEYFENEGRNHANMKKYVLDYVQDAIENLLCTVNDKSDIVLIMSGRSVLYPGIKECVNKSLKDSGCKKIQLWNGYNNADGNFDPEKVKSAVAVGACWYGMYNYMINIHHNLVTSSFGYIDFCGGEQKFIPLIERGCKYDDNGECQGSGDTLGTTLRAVRFVQMLGMNYDEIYAQDIKHKMNSLDIIRGQEISTWASRIEIVIDNRNNFSYVVYDGNKKITKENNPDSRLSVNDIKAEIVDENSKAYIFATLNAIEENAAEVIAAERSTSPRPSINTTRNTYKSNRNRF